MNQSKLILTISTEMIKNSLKDTIIVKLRGLGFLNTKKYIQLLDFIKCERTELSLITSRKDIKRLLLKDLEIEKCACENFCFD